MADKIVDLGDGVLIRNGVLCACRDLHGIFPQCVGSKSPLAESLGLLAPQPKHSRTKAEYRTSAESIELLRAENPFGLTAEDFARRRRLSFGPKDIAACPDCTIIHRGYQYCDKHRELAVQNVLKAAKTDPGIGTLHLMAAEEFGLDPTVEVYPAPAKEPRNVESARTVVRSAGSRHLSLLAGHAEVRPGRQQEAA